MINRYLSWWPICIWAFKVPTKSLTWIDIQVYTSYIFYLMSVPILISNILNWDWDSILSEHITLNLQCQSVSPSAINTTKPNLASIQFVFKVWILNSSQPPELEHLKTNKTCQSFQPLFCSSYLDSTAFLPYHRIDTPQIVKILLTIAKEPKQI